MGLLSSLLSVVFLVGSCIPPGSEAILELSLKPLIEGQTKILQKLDEQGRKIQELENKLNVVEGSLKTVEKNIGQQLVEYQNCASRSQFDTFENVTAEQQERATSLQQCSTREEISDLLDLHVAGLESKLIVVEEKLVEYQNCTSQSQLDAFQNTFIAEQQERARSLQLCSTRDQISDLLDLHIVDECREGSHNCHEMATCTDTLSDYKCNCLSGYTGDGFNCEIICESPSQVIPGLGCVIPVEERLNWDESQNYCETRNATLVEGIEKRNLRLLAQQFYEYFRAQSVWVGFRNGQWVKSRGPVALHRWGDGEYDRFDSDNKCGIVSLTGSLLFLFDLNCSDSRQFLCQRLR